MGNEEESKYGVLIREAINQKIINLVDETIRVAPYNKFKKGLITEKISGTTDFRVKIDENEYYPISALKSALPLNKNDLVFCIVPDNQISNIFIIGTLSTEINQ